MAENYVVTDQSIIRDYSLGNRVVDMYLVDFMTPEGDSGHVRIPADRYTPEHVAQELDAAARVLRAVRNL